MLQKRIKRLKQKLITIRNRIHHSSRMMRKFPLGQDRYARQYWVLPSLGAILIEGVETSLDANLQLEPVARDGSGGEEGVTPRHESAGARQGGGIDASVASSSRVILREDLRQMVVSDTPGDQGAELGLRGGAVSGGVAETSEGCSSGCGLGGECVESQQGVAASSSSAGINPGDVASSKMATSEEREGERDGPDIATTHTSERAMMMECEPSVSTPREEGGAKIGADFTQQSDGATEGQVRLDRNEMEGVADGGMSQEAGLGAGTESGGVSVGEGHQLAPMEQEGGGVVCTTEPGSGYERGSPHVPLSSVAPDERPIVLSQQSVAGAAVVQVGEEQGVWFSLFPREPCETSQVTYINSQQQQQQGGVALPSQQVALVATTTADSAQLQTQQQQQQQQQVLAAAATSATPTQQYVYVTPDGQVVGGTTAAAATPQVVGGGAGMAYALVGNTLVPVASQQPQYVAVNPAPQQGVQYVIAQQDQQGGIQYFAVGGPAAAGGGGGDEGGVASGARGGGAWQSASAQQQQQPQILAVSDGSGQQQLVQVVAREDGGQMLVQVTPEQLQAHQQQQQQLAPSASGGTTTTPGGQGVLVATATPTQQQQGVSASGGVVLAGNPAAAAQSNQVLVGQGQGGAGGQVILAPQPGQGGQVVLAQPGGSLSGGVVLATPQGNQVVVGAGQGQAAGGQVVLVAPPPQAGVEGQGQVVLATQSGQVVMGGQGDGGVGVAGGVASSSAVLVDEQSREIIRGGRLVQLPDGEQYGILSADGTKLIVAGSKEAAIATLQAAHAAVATTTPTPPAGGSHASGLIRRPPSTSPIPPPSAVSPAPPSRASPLTQHQQSGYAGVRVKKEPQSPVYANSDPSFHTAYAAAASSSRMPSATPPLSGKATPTTVGQSTASAETVDLTRQPANQEVCM